MFLDVLATPAEQSSPIAYASIIRNKINKKCFCRPVNVEIPYLP